MITDLKKKGEIVRKCTSFAYFYTYFFDIAARRLRRATVSTVMHDYLLWVMLAVD